MPTWDVRSSHEVEIRAEPEAVYEAILRTDFSRNALLRFLLALRAIPALLLAPRTAWQQWRQVAKAPTAGPAGHLFPAAFTQLEATPPSELVFGLTGRFWTPAGDLVPTDPTTFREAVPPGLARGAWNFHIQPLAPGRTSLRTETRVTCGDPATRRSFLRYWRIIRRGSGVIRWALLRQIKTAAEGAAG
jgi:hypothetical protein